MSRRTCSRIAGLALLAGALPLMPAPAQASDGGLPTPSVPTPIQQKPPPTLAPQLPSPLRRSPKPPLPASQAPTPGAATMVVNRFRFVGNTVFTNAELEKSIASYLNRPVSFADLGEARNAITQLYIEKGYTTSGAYIPMQASEDGIVEIRILEGRLGEVNVSVKGRLRPGYIKSRLQLAGRGVLNVPRLFEALRLLQANPLIETISANLTASPQAGVSNLDVKAVSARTFQLALAMDNGRNQQTGSVRRGIDLSQANLLGNGDVLSLTYRNSGGSNDALLSYQVPLNPSDLTLTASYRYLSSWIIQPADFAKLDINSLYQQAFIGLRLPLLRSVEKEFALGLSLNRQDNRGLFLEGLPFPTRGSNDKGETRVTTLSFNQDYIQRSAKDVLAIRSEIGIGLAGLDATTPYDYGANPDSPDASFLLWRGDLQYLRQLGRDVTLIARARAQVSDGTLPPVEQFGLGGLGSVEGYQTNSLLTDSGLFGSLELAVPVWRWPRQKGLLQVVPFTAIGYGWDRGVSPQPRTNLLASVGLGLQLRLGDKFYGRVDYAQRLGPTPYAISDIWQDQAILFNVRYTP